VVDSARDFDNIAAGAWTLAGNPAQLTNITEVGGVFTTVTSIMGSFNNVQLDQMTIGLGLRVDGAPSPANNFEAVRAADEDTNFWGWWSSSNGAVIGKGKLFIGPATVVSPETACNFIDEAFTVIFADERVAADFYEIAMEGANTVVDWSLANISAANPDNARWRITVNDATFTDLNGVWTGAAFLRMGAGATLNGTTIIRSKTLLQNGADLSGVTFNQSLTSAAEFFEEFSPRIPADAALISDDPSLVANCTFVRDTGSTGNAIRATTAGTYSFVGNSFSGYGADGTSTAAFHNASGGLITLNISGGGDTPTVLNSAGSTTVVNNTVTLRVTVSDDQGNPVQGARVAIYDYYTIPGVQGDELLDPDGGGRRFQDDRDGTNNYLESPNFNDISSGFANSSTHIIEFTPDSTLVSVANSPDSCSLFNIRDVLGDVQVLASYNKSTGRVQCLLSDVSGVPVIRSLIITNAGITDGVRYRLIFRVENANHLIAIQEVGVTDPSPRLLDTDTGATGGASTGKLSIGADFGGAGLQFGGVVHRYIHNTDPLTNTQIFAILDGGDPTAVGTVAEEYDLRGGSLAKANQSPEDALVVTGGGRCGVPFEPGGGLLTDVNGQVENTGHNFVGGSPNVEPVQVRVRKSSIFSPIETRYQPTRQTASITPSGLNINVTVQTDTVAENS
jgi:hypothetical protein